MNMPIETLSWSQPSLEWLIAVAALSVLISLALAWLATLIIYGRVEALRKIFPVSHNLIRAHIDYLIMASLLGVAYFACLGLGVVLPSWVIVLLCFGVLYNPIGFIVQAHNPKAGKSDALSSRILVCVGFLPTTIGFTYTYGSILLKL